MKIKRGFIRVTCAVLAVLFFVVETPVTAKADTYWPEGPSISTPTAIVMDVYSGTILYEKNSDEVNYPASITKIMTTMLALENCELDEIVTFSADAVYKNEGGTSHIARDLGEEMTMEECLYAVMLESANECAYAVAEHVGAKLGGDYQTFIDLMNTRAAELGCTNTHFNNANGLPDKDHWTSARDMALIAQQAYKNETFRIITGTKTYQIPPTNKHADITYLNNHHKMLHYYKTSKYIYEYCTGGKTGYTDASGSTLVTFAEKDGLALVSVVMRTNSTAEWEDTIELMDYCFQHFHTVSLSENVVSSIGNQNIGIMNTYPSFVEMAENSYVVLPITAEFSDLQQTLVDEEVPEGVIAQLQYTYDGRPVGSADIIPSQVSVKDNYFDYANEKPEETDKKVVQVKPSSIIMASFIMAVIIAVFLLGKYFFDNYYVLVHDMNTKKERKKRFRPVRKKRRRWTKKDRMFK